MAVQTTDQKSEARRTAGRLGRISARSHQQGLVGLLNSSRKFYKCNLSKEFVYPFIRPHDSKIFDSRLSYLKFMTQPVFLACCRVTPASHSLFSVSPPSSCHSHISSPQPHSPCPIYGLWVRLSIDHLMILVFFLFYAELWIETMSKTSARLGFLTLQP